MQIDTQSGSTVQHIQEKLSVQNGKKCERTPEAPQTQQAKGDVVDFSAEGRAKADAMLAEKNENSENKSVAQEVTSDASNVQKLQKTLQMKKSELHSKQDKRDAAKRLAEDDPSKEDAVKKLDQQISRLDKETKKIKNQISSES